MAKERKCNKPGWVCSVQSGGLYNLNGFSMLEGSAPNLMLNIRSPITLHFNYISTYHLFALPDCGLFKDRLIQARHTAESLAHNRHSRNCKRILSHRLTKPILRTWGNLSFFWFRGLDLSYTYIAMNCFMSFKWILKVHRDILFTGKEKKSYKQGSLVLQKVTVPGPGGSLNLGESERKITNLKPAWATYQEMYSN